MLLGVHFSSIHRGDIEFQHAANTLKLVELTGLVVTSEDKVLSASSQIILWSWAEADKDVYSVSRIEIKLTRNQSKSIQLDRLRFYLLLIIIIFLTEELEPTITTCVKTPEDHIHFISEPARTTVKGICQLDHWWFPPSSDRHIETAMLRNKSD